MRRLPFQYVVYRFDNGNIDFTNGQNIKTLIPFDSKDLTFLDNSVVTDYTYTYAVTVVDCQLHETPADDIATVGPPIRLPPPPPSRASIPKTCPVKKEKKKRKGFWCWLFGCKN